MSAATTNQPPAQPPDPGQPSRFARLLNLVRKLIDYGKELAATLQQQQRTPTTDLAAVTRPFGTSDIGLILARIARGLLWANALEARVVQMAGRPEPPPAPDRAPHPACAAHPPASTARAHRRARPASRPPPHVRTDRRRGPPPPDRRRHCRHLPRPRHPAEPSAVAGIGVRHNRKRRQRGHPRQNNTPAAVSHGQTHHVIRGLAACAHAAPGMAQPPPALNSTAGRTVAHGTRTWLAPRCRLTAWHSQPAPLLAAPWIATPCASSRTYSRAAQRPSIRSSPRAPLGKKRGRTVEPHCGSQRYQCPLNRSDRAQEVTR